MRTTIDVKMRIRKHQIRDLVAVAVPTGMSEMDSYYLVTYELEGPAEVIELMTNLSQSDIRQIAA